MSIERAVFLGTSMGGLITMTLMAIRPKAIAAAILNDVGPAIAPEGIARILGYAGKKADISDWNDAADYVRRTNAVAFPDFDDEDWHRFAQRTFRQGADGPELDYDPAIAVPLSKPPSKLAPWIAGSAVPPAGAQDGRPCSSAARLSDMISSDNRRPNAAAGPGHEARRRAQCRPCADADRAGRS